MIWFIISGTKSCFNIGTSMWMYSVWCKLWSYLYPRNIILHFLYILVSHNHTKTHKLLFHWFLILLAMNRLAYSCLFTFFISNDNTFSEKDFVVWSFGSNKKTIPSCFAFDKFTICMFFFYFLWFFQTLHYSLVKENLFQNPFCILYSSVLTLMSGFNLFSLLNLMTLHTFFNTNLWFSVCFRLLMRITYFSLPCTLATSFSTFPIFILSVKKGKSLWNSCNLSMYTASTSIIYLSLLSSLQLWNLN